MLIAFIILIPSLAFVTFYRVWLNFQIYRIKMNYKGIEPSKAKRYSQREVERMNEYNFYILFCFFTFFWVRYRNSYKSLQIKSNYMMLLTLIIIMLLVLTVTMGMNRV